MTSFRVHGTLMVDESLDDLALAYKHEVGWAQGFRINIDTRLMLLGVQRLLTSKLVSEPELRQSALVVGCRLGAMDSYEAFEASLATNQATPLAFAYALPSMPLAGVSVRHGMRGMTYTLTGQKDVGLRALRQGVGLLVSGRADRAIIGCWETPSRTAQYFNPSTRCRLLLAIIEPVKAGASFFSLANIAPGGSFDADCVAMLATCLCETDSLGSIGTTGCA
ncbi:MAG: hypothetical protein KJ900_17660 [Proteobacteria bacterium]|nr:hypothetical protein [Desulfocapsa sp.]MBU4030521.1 hypothetical protein [Pseudomonadota bacterium]MBU4044691.1 hypothetical protein [Pseudomonadota bacterium]